MNLQPTWLKNASVALMPLKAGDFNALYAVASDPLIWEQHPNKDRYLKEVFEVFFKEAIESKGAFLVTDAITGAVIGSSRYYQYHPEEKSVAIGYTFLSRSCWGNTYNRFLKELMLNHAFEYVDQVFFHVGVNNIRSQKAVLKLGASRSAAHDPIDPDTHAPQRFTYLLRREVWHQD